MTIQRLPGTAITPNSIPASALGATVQLGGPKISNIQVTTAGYAVLDDTAVDLAGGYIKISGSGFQSGCTVLIGGLLAPAVTFVGSTELNVQVPAQSAGTYVVYVTNPDGGVAIRLTGLTYSATPSWVTGSTLSEAQSDIAISIQLSASLATAYSLQVGSVLPTGLTLSNVGLLSGTVSNLVNDTTYSFTVVATDAELQDSPRTFTITITVGQKVTRSLRFNNPDSTSMVRKPATAGNRRTWTWSCWIKKTRNGTYDPFFSGWLDTPNRMYLSFSSADKLQSFCRIGGVDQLEILTNAVFRDNSSWYHVVYACDTTLATGTDRLKIWVNGQQQTLAWTTTPAQNTELYINSAVDHYIGQHGGGDYSSYMLAESYFIDGSALTPSSFGETDPYTGVWRPKLTYTGAYGQNGFYLPFSDNSSVLNLGRNQQPLTADPFWNRTVLLLNGTGTNNANNSVFTDSSSNTFAITRSGNATQGTFSPFSQGGYSFSTTATNTFDLPGSVLAFGSSSFTLEAWLYMTHASGGPIVYPYNSGNAVTNAGFSIGISTTGSSYYAVNGSTPIAYGGTLYLSTWYHLALVKDGTAARLYIDGKLVATGTDSTTYSTPTGGARIGGIYNLTQTYGLVVNNLRIVTGQALYNSNFTPANTNLTAGFIGHQGLESTAITGTVRVLTARDPYRIDRSSNNHTIGASGSPQIVPLSPFTANVAYSAAVNGGSAYFDGTGDYLTSVTNTVTAFNLTGDFTIECWAYFTSASTAGQGLVTWADSGGWNGWQFINDAGTIKFEFLAASSAAATATGGSVGNNQWYHLAVVRSGGASNNVTVYINGSSTGSTTYTGTQGTSASSYIRIGVDRTLTNEVVGYVSSVRVINGTALYTGGTLTVPTAPLTAVANTALLLNFVNAGIVDATGDNNFGTVADAKISTAQSKWGSSMAFDGTGDSLVPSGNSDNYAFGTGDFTIEFWVYFNVISEQILYDSRPPTTDGLYPCIYLIDNISQNIRWRISGVDRITSSVVSPTTWYHLAVVRNGSSTKMYINGVQTGSTYSDTNNYLNGSNRPIISGSGYGVGNGAINGYLQDVRVTRAARYTGTFTPPTAQFAYNQGDINYNQWVPTNFSVTAGAGNDSLLDSPTAYGTDTGLGGEVRGNYCTWNPLYTNSVGVGSLSNGLLEFSVPNTYVSTANMAMTSGKWYWEVTPTTNALLIGIKQVNITDRYGSTIYYGGASITGGGIYVNGNPGANFANWTVGDVIGVAPDMDVGVVNFYKNGVLQGNVSLSSAGITVPVPAVGSGASLTFAGVANFGQRPFAYAAPSGFKALNTQNLPTTTVGFGSDQQANDYFDTVLYTGNGTSQTVTGLQFRPDFVWIKLRNENPSSTWHRLIDSVRGGDRRLSSNDTQAETQSATLITAFTANGFSIGSDSGINSSGLNIVAWCWRAGGNAVVNTAGSIQSNVSVNTTAGFSIVSATTNGSGLIPSTGHGLGVVPAFIIIKDRDGADSWYVYHKSTGTTGTLNLNTTGAVNTTNGTSGGVDKWTLTTTTVGIGNAAWTYGANRKFIMYLWAEVPGFSAFGSYTGNGSANGPFVYTGFRPSWVLIKVATGSPAADWVLHDTSRSPYNVSDTKLSPNTSDADVTTSAVNIDILSSGFKIRNTDGAYNTSSNTYIYAAFAESPFKTARSR